MPIKSEVINLCAWTDTTRIILQAAPTALCWRCYSVVDHIPPSKAHMCEPSVIILNLQDKKCDGCQHSSQLTKNASAQKRRILEINIKMIYFQIKN